MDRRRPPFRPLQPTRVSPALAKSTPPRELILTPRATPKPVRRRPKPKSEPPEIDPASLRPPSPSDDPLLLASESPGALPVFKALRVVDQPVWSDSDDDDFNLTGEYTGKYKILKVPTKPGPPTRHRAHTWGRPVSPFPYSEIMERSLPLAEDPAPCDDATMWEAATEPPPSDVELDGSPEPEDSEDEFAVFDRDFPVFSVAAESTQVLSHPKPCPLTLEEEEEDQIDRELSLVPEDGPRLPVDTMAEDSSDEEDDVEGEDIVKITSDDPKAAARAAAILRLHDYDCILAAEKRKRPTRPTKTRKRRKTIESAAISKSYMDLRSRPPEPGNTSPGSRSLPLLELWRDAEDSVFLEHHSKSQHDVSFTLSPLRPVTTPPEPLLPPPTGEWTRDCWKSLDKSLVAERLAVAAARGLGPDVFAEMGDISKDAVLDRFTHQLGGESALAGLGPDWSRNNLMLRLDLLIKKQPRRAMRREGPPRHTAIEPRYRGLLQEAMALSWSTRDLSMTSASDTSALSANKWVKPEPSPLPLPCSDPEWLSRGLRGPLTPEPTPEGTTLHPKEQVQLRHMSPVPKSRIPVPVRPKRLVDLRHASPIKAADRARRNARRSSGCSVRDLVKQFENPDE